MESELKMTQNPLQTQVVVQTQVQTREEEKKLEPILEKARRIYNGLQEDIQRHLIEEYIKPELNGTLLIKEFDKIIESEECQRLEWDALADIVEKIINHEGALSQMCEIDTLGFRDVYRRHFIRGKNTFVLFDTPLSSMCAELVMRKWH
jgi:hypothetical protein